MSTKKAGGSTRLGRDSISKRLGVKAFGSQFVTAGSILIRQRGTKFHPGANTKQGSDDTIYAVVDGIVEFKKKKTLAFTGNLKKRTYISILPVEYEVEEINEELTN
jgi:large subunit ribosomal protein L27